MENDRDPGIESYIKDFIPKTLGEFTLQKGRKMMTIKATHIPGNSAMDVRLLMFRRVK